MLRNKRNRRDTGTATDQTAPTQEEEGIERDKLKSHMARRGTLEADLFFEIKKSRSLAWKVAAGGFFCGIVGLGLAGFTLHRYAQPIASQLLTLDSDTGIVEPTQLVTSQKSYGEAVDAGYVARYIQVRESYNYYQQQTLYDTTMLMSSRTVAQPYAAQFGGQNSLDKRWGDSKVVRVEINSVIANPQTGQATVRYTTQRQDRGQRLPDPEQHWIATLSYEYPNRTMDVDDRYKNPLGFLVTSFDKHAENTGR
ncbi:virB8 family protein [Salinicola sp. NYA28a]